MNKQQILKILQNKRGLEKDDISEIQDLENKYPYSQMVHVISAIGSRKFKHSEANTKLTTAAVYATDRSLLKKIMLSQKIGAQSTQATSTENGTKSKKAEPASKATKPTKPTKPTQPTQPTQPTRSPIDGSERIAVEKEVSGYPDHPGLLSEKDAEALRKDVMKNLEDLLEIKKNFLKDMELIDGKASPSSSFTSKVQNKSATAIKKIKSKPVKVQVKSKVKSVKSPSPKKVPARIKIVGKVKSTKLNIPSSEIKKEPVKKLRVVKSSYKSKTSLSPDKSKKNIPAKKNREQQEIIDKFIKKEPSIKRKKAEEPVENSSDLSKSSVSFGNDLVSENLAKVMIKQGKINKAIDIYKKLIWKFPQKKAYFASQIESLKEK